MIIGIDANEANLTRQRVGVNNFAYFLIKALKQVATNHKYVVYLKNPPLEDMPNEDEHWQYRVIPFPKLWTQTRLPFDLFFHSPRPNVFFSTTHYAPRVSPIPTVISIMDLGFLMFPDQFTRKDLAQLTNWTSYSVKNASKIVSISENTKKDIVGIYGKNPCDVVVAYPGYDSERFFRRESNEETKKILSKYNIYKEYILFLSSLKPSKNILNLVKAYASLKLPYGLVIAGKKAWMYDEIYEQVRNLNLTEKVIFTDFVKDEHAPILMSQAKVFTLPSFYEGFGIPVLEAMGSGVPVVISRSGSLEEVGGDAAIYVDPKSPESIAGGISLAISNRKKLIPKVLAQAKKFSWEQTATKVLMTLESAAL